MTKRNPPSETTQGVANEQGQVKLPPGQNISLPDSQKACLSRCNNLLQNPGFEAGLTGWETNNVIASDSNSFEGTQVARLGPGVASMFQDISLGDIGDYPLLLSFEAVAGNTQNVFNGNLVAEVSWLDASLNQIGTGLRFFIQDGAIDTRIHTTYFDITDLPPANAAWARLSFSKGAGRESDTIELDQVILTPADSINLVQNSGFQKGFTGWTATNSSPRFSSLYEGTAYALLEGNNATLSQDVSLGCFPANTPFLFSFATNGVKGSLDVQVLWLDHKGNTLGMPGLTLSISDSTLENQNNYLTYLDVTQPAPDKTAQARIVFTAREIAPPPIQPDINIDKVILANAKTTNLVKNFSFENDLSGWTAVDTTVATIIEAYEGNKVARIPANGGVLFQDIPIPSSTGCLLLNFGYKANGTSPGSLLAEVRWLDKNNEEIGLGLSLVVPSDANATTGWLVYTGITEPAPQGAVTASVQFSKSQGSNNIDIDKVVLSRLT